MLDFQLSKEILFFNYPNPEKALFSILIPSWNNYVHLKLVIESIQKNSTYVHQICVHLNEGDESSKTMLENLKISHTYSTENTGVCFGFNAASSLAKCDYLVLMDDDMYVAPEWDYWLYEEIKKQKDIYWSISGSMMEREGRENPSVIYCKNYGATTKEFDESLFLDEYATYPHHDWSGSMWYPLVLHKNMWTLIGGLSTEFSPGMYSDPDFMIKLWQAGVRNFIGLSKSRVYHFMSKSTSRITKNDGRSQFLLKWKLSNSVFSKHFLQLGQKYDGLQKQPDLKKLKWKLVLDRIKSMFNF